MRVAKFVIAAVAAGAATLATLVGDDVITINEWVTVALVVLGALGVYRVPNEGGTSGGSQFGSSSIRS